MQNSVTQSDTPITPPGTAIRRAVIGGTGLNELHRGGVAGSRDTPFGAASADIVMTEVEQTPVAFLARHGRPHAIAPHKINYRANLWALKQLGVESVIAVNAVGAIDKQLSPGSIVLPDQLVDYTYGRDHTFYDGDHAELLGSPLAHCDFTVPFSDRLRAVLSQAATAQGICVCDKSVYAVTQGPRLESIAEVDRLEKDGCDIVGMTAMPEAGLARELGMEYASVCLVVNPAAGRSDGIITMADIQAVIDNTMLTVRRLLSAAIPLL